MAFKVFVSYSSRDLPLVEQVRRSLAGTGVKIFIAEHSVRPGESLPTKILGAIKQCDLFILLWSSNSRQSEWVPQEIGAARAAGKLILPVLLERGLQLPGFLGDLKYLSVRGNPEAALSSLWEIVSAQVVRKQQGELVGWGVLGVLAILALSDVKVKKK